MGWINQIYHPMFKIPRFLITIILFSSCATLIHQNTTRINVHSDYDTVKVCLYNDTSKWYATPAVLEVERSKFDLLLLVDKDSTRELLQVNSKLSTAFWLGNMFSGAGIVGYAIDLTNPRRFTYPRGITIRTGTENTYRNKYLTWLNPEKGLLSIKMSIPEGNHYYLNKGNGYGNNFGFLGISGGLEYYYTDKNSISTTVGISTDFFFPLPVPVDYWGPYESTSAFFGNIQMGSDFHRLHYGAGLQYNKSYYNKWDKKTDEFENYRYDTLVLHKFQNKLGLELSSYFSDYKRI